MWNTKSVIKHQDWVDSEWHAQEKQGNNDNIRNKIAYLFGMQSSDTWLTSAQVIVGTQGLDDEVLRYLEAERLPTQYPPSEIVDLHWYKNIIVSVWSEMAFFFFFR